ncbi:MAG: tetratricopeptide repeat protein [Pseudomonadota bacterium]
MTVRACRTFLTCLVLSWIGPASAQHLTGPLLQEIEQAAEAGSVRAQAELARRYLTGDGVLQHYARGAEWLLRAAEQGDPAAQNELGRLYHEGLGVTPDQAVALHWLAEAAATGTAQHVFDYAAVLETQLDGAAAAAELYRKAAEAGHLDAIVSLGVLYQDGTGVTRDPAQARALYEQGAEAGHSRALNNLGLLYVRGDGVTQDYERAARLFAKAAETGLPSALTNLGVMYENGFGVPLDETRAADLYRQGGSGSDPGAPPAWIQDPRLRPIDLSLERRRDLTRAADAGDPIGQFQLALVLVSNQAPTFPDLQRAAQLFRSAADKGHGPAMANLSLMYFQGLAVPQDYMLAQMWMALAGHSGVDTSALAIAFAGKATSGQINRAQDQAQAWIEARDK